MSLPPTIFTLEWEYPVSRTHLFKLAKSQSLLTHRSYPRNSSGLLQQKLKRKCLLFLHVYITLMRFLLVSTNLPRAISKLFEMLLQGFRQGPAEELILPVPSSPYTGFPNILEYSLKSCSLVPVNPVCSSPLLHVGLPAVLHPYHACPSSSEQQPY